MDRNEATRATKDLVERLTPKLPDRDEAAFIERSARAGEPGVALAELVAILVDERIAVAALDKDLLRSLLARYREGAEDVDRLSVAVES